MKVLLFTDCYQQTFLTVIFNKQSVKNVTSWIVLIFFEHVSDIKKIMYVCRGYNPCSLKPRDDTVSLNINMLYFTIV
jgi:hypothetical protein